LKSSKSQDFLHCFTAATILGGLLLPRRNRQLSLHEITEGRIERTALRVIAKVLFSRLIFASKYLKNFYKLSGQVIYSGGDIEKFLAVPEISIMENEAIQILCVGRFNHWKGQHVAIDAARILKESNCNFHLSFLGSGFYDDSYYQQCKDLASNFFLSERVTFLEERDDITGVLGRAHILIVPSIKPEPFGKVVVEGMAASRVVIATRVGGPAEIIEDGKSGALVDNANPTQLAETVRRFIEDTNLYDRVKREARSRSKDFSESTMTHSYLKSIEELTGLNFRGGE
jgi:glycosyltransferase involved in cell wall biosynthesis